jgi:hypothetical protein
MKGGPRSRLVTVQDGEAVGPHRCSPVYCFGMSGIAISYQYWIFLNFTMPDPSDYATPATLLGRLRAAPQDPVAWSEFVAWYGGEIYAWCRAWGLQDADAQDVTQEVFLNLTVRMHDFRYDRRAASGVGSGRSRTMRGGTTWRSSGDQGKGAAARPSWSG